jgi:TatD DNase family protein
VTHCVQIGCDIASSLAAIDLAKRYPNWFASVGYHPIDAQKGVGRLSREFLEQELRTLVEQNSAHVVAIGETGLDCHYLSEVPEERDVQFADQMYWFGRMAQMAKDYSLPLIIHTREAREQTLEAIRLFDIRFAVIHCFSEDWAFAENLLAHSPDIFFSFSGIVTYKNAPSIQEAATKIPLDRILIETDAPFLSPVPKRGETNEPSYTRYVLEKIQSLRSESPEEIEETLFQNSLRFYQIR